MAITRVRIEPESHHDPLNQFLASRSGADTLKQPKRALVVSKHGSKFCTLSTETLQSVDAENQRDVQWYYEEYALKDPFAKARADAVRYKLRQHGQRLLKEFLLPEICPSSIRNDCVLLEIHDAKYEVEDDESSSLQKFYWEILEDRSLWQEVYNFEPASIHVVRVHSSSTASKSVPVSPSAMKRVLAITARPSLTKDIPHRLITRSIADAVNVIGRSKASLEIVRPGTFAALEERITSHPPGYFQVLHLDLHGDADDTGGRLTFVRFDKSMRSQPHEKPAEDLASILVARGISTVVINACRSSIGYRQASNVSSILVKAGIKTVIGMAFNILSLTAGVFMREFYQCFLGQSLSATRAISYARGVLRQQPIRTTKFYTQVELADYLVPVIHCNRSEVSDLQSLHLDTPVTQLSSNGADFQDVVLGREGDMLRLESRLTQPNRINIHLAGSAGIGKTALLEYAAAWWKDTGLYDKVIHIRLEDKQYKDVTIDSLKGSIGTSIGITAEDDGKDPVVEKLNSGSYLLILDSLEASQWDPRHGRPERAAQLRVFLRALKGCSVIISSRLDDAWLGSSVGLPLRLDGLDTIHAVALGHLLLRAPGERHNISISKDDLPYFENLADLVQGNPLAMSMMVDDFIHNSHSNSVDLKSYLISVLQFRPVSIDTEKIRTHPGARSVAQAIEFFESKPSHPYGGTLRWTDCIDKYTMAASLMAFWHHIPSNIEPFISTLNTLCRLRFNLPNLTDDLDTFKAYRKRLRERVEECASEKYPVFSILALGRSPKGIGLSPDLAKAYSSGAKIANTIFKDLLLIELEEFVSPPKTQKFGRDGDGGYEMSYYSINPIFTFVAMSLKVRDTCLRNFSDDVAVARAAMYEYHENLSQRLNLLPSSAARQAARMELKLDFFNHVSLQLSYQSLESWPFPQDWQGQWVVSEAALDDHRLFDLALHTMHLFIVPATNHLRRLRLKYKRPEGKGYDIASKSNNFSDWNVASAIEVALTAVLIRALAVGEIQLRSDEFYVECWRFLVQEPMFAVFIKNQELLNLLLASHSANSKALDVSSGKVSLDILTVEELATTSSDLIQHQRTFLKIPQVTETLEKQPDNYEAARHQYLENVLTSMGLQNSVTGRHFMILKAVRGATSEDVRNAISNLEDLLEEEVESSNEPRARVMIHNSLARLHQRLGNRAASSQHLASMRTAASMLEPEARVREDNIKSSWELYSRKMYLKNANPQTDFERLEFELESIRQKLNNSEQQGEEQKVILFCMSNVALSLTELGRHSEAAEYYRRVLDGQRRVFPLNDPKLVTTMFGLGKALSNLQQHNEAIRLLRIVRSEYAKSDSDHQVYLNATGVLGLVIFRRVQSSGTLLPVEEQRILLDEAQAYLEESGRINERRSVAPDENTARAVSNLAMLFEHRKNFERAETYYMESINIRRAIRDSVASDGILSSQNNLAGLWSSMGKDEEASKLYKHVLDQRIESYGIRSESTLLAMGNLHFQYRQMKKLDDAKQLAEDYTSSYTTSIGVAVEKVGREHFDVERANRQLAFKLVDCRSFDVAIEMLEAIVAAWEKIATRAAELAEVLGKLASCYENRKPPMMEAALGAKSREVELRTECYGQRHQDTLKAMGTRVMYLRSLGRLSLAIVLQEQLIDARTALKGSNDTQTLDSIIYLGWLHVDMEDWQAAASQFKKGFDGRMALDPNWILIADVAAALSFSYYSMDDWDKALEYRREAWRIQCHSKGADSDEAVTQAAEIAIIVHKSGNHKEALALLRPVLESRARVLPSDDFKILQLKIQEAIIFREDGDLPKAEEILNDILLKRRRHPQEDNITIRASGVLAEVYKRQGHSEKSINLLKHAISLRRQLIDVEVPRSLEELYLERLAKQCMTEARWDEAATAVQERLETMGAQKLTITKAAKIADCLRLQSVVDLKRGDLKRRKSSVGKPQKRSSRRRHSFTCDLDM